VDWYFISYYQPLSDEFIREFADDLDWGAILRNKIESEDFINEFKDKLLQG
jgi:hypothetical protein